VPVTELLLDPAKSRVRIRTFAEGLFAKLAHDLELTCGKLEGRASRNDDSLTIGTATVDVPVGGIEVAGVLKGDTVDERGLSPSDRTDCLEKMRKDVFQCGPSGTVRVHVVLDGGSARVKIVPPNGRSIERTARPTVTDDGEGRVRVKGAVDVSLASIGSATVKGPMNAFRVKDRVEILFDIVFAPT
jgi:hypothetical protein